jgi:hypothetical protein
MSDITNWKHCTNGRKVISHTTKRGCTTRSGKGDHVVVYDENGHRVTVVDGYGQQSPGVARSIFKALAAAGLLTALFAATLTALLAAFPL